VNFGNPLSYNIAYQGPIYFLVAYLSIYFFCLHLCISYPRELTILLEGYLSTCGYTKKTKGGWVVIFLHTFCSGFHSYFCMRVTVVSEKLLWPPAAKHQLRKPSIAAPGDGAWMCISIYLYPPILTATRFPGHAYMHACRLFLSFPTHTKHRIVRKGVVKIHETDKGWFCHTSKLNTIIYTRCPKIGFELPF